VAEQAGTVGVVGLGQVGGALATSLLRAGFTTCGFDISPDRMELFEQAGGEGVDSPAAVGQQSGIVLLSLPSVSALDAVTAERGGLQEAHRPDLIVIEASTLPIPAKERARDRLAAAGAVLVDCPVSGTAAQARQADLTVFASGDENAVRRCAAVFDAIGRSWRYLGAFGDGSRMKFVANLLIAVHNMAAAEALVLGAKAGLDPQLTYEVISESAATSRMFEVSGRLMIEGRYEDASAKVAILHKDLQLIREFATGVLAPTPLMAATAEFYTSAMALGMAAMEDASVALLLQKLAGVDLAPRHSDRPA
jgi:L-threonate 2-dehydrogenase